jgi:hypothetical protein
MSSQVETFLSGIENEISFQNSPTIVCPGDDVTEKLTNSTKQIALGKS